jgi:predicted murein hydrolase (TIGR00659 family)
VRQEIREVWIYLSATPLLWLTATVLAYLAADWIWQRSRKNPLLNPMVLATGLLIALLSLTDTTYEAYFEGAQCVHFLLGPATVALAIPLYANFARVKRALPAIFAALAVGSATAERTAVGLVLLLGGSLETARSIAPKSVTTPIAMGIAEQIGGLPSLTAALVLITGVIGAMTATPVLNAVGLKDWRARGFAVGIAAHGLGVARAFQVNEVAGTFAGVAMALNGMATAILVPVVLQLLP